MKVNMSKKLRKLVKKNLNRAFMELKNAFSLVEIAISLLVISIIIAALTPTISKRLTASSSIKNRISTNCNSIYPDGYCAMCYITPKKCISCTKTCNTNQFKNVDSCECEDCSKKYGNPNCARCNSKKCTQCAQGYYLDSKSNCMKCPKGYYCFQEGDGSVKKPCSKGFVAGVEGMSACVPCNKSTAQQAGSVAPNEGMSACIPCAGGQYASSSGQSSCKPCPVGNYCQNGKISPCAKGSANDKQGQVSCVSCVKSTDKIQGSVAPNTGMTKCILCGNGQYAQSAAQGQNCTPCPAGRYCVNGKIIPCAKGTAQGNTGQSSCVPCQKSANGIAGTIAPNTGMTSCSVCGNGKYTAASGQASCSNCPAGYKCPNGQLIKCTIGTISTGNASNCTSCTGASTSSEGASACVACANGCTSCYGTGSNCTSCKSGYYKNGSGCSRCPAGSSCAGGTAKPVQCAVGYYASTGSAACVSCGAGKSSTKGSSSCFDCNPSCTTCSGSANSCSSCKNGYYKQGSSCSSCPAGYYCKNNTSTICPKDNYCPAGAINPTPCPDGLIAAEGAKSQDECESEEWECEFEFLWRNNETRKRKGTKYGKLCVMDSSDKEMYDTSAKNRNLTWTQITEGNLSSFCKDVNDHFSLAVTTCQGQTYYTQDVGKIGYKEIDYASSCKMTILDCGQGTSLRCKVDKAPCSNYYYKDYHISLCRLTSNCGITTTKKISILYSYDLSAAAEHPNAVVSYYTFYSGASSGNSSCTPMWCSNDMLPWAKNTQYIVRKSGS